MLSMLSYLAMVENKWLGIYVGQIYTSSIEFWTQKRAQNSYSSRLFVAT